MHQVSIAAEIVDMLQSVRGQEVIGLVTIVLVFGTGILSVLLFGTAQIIRALRGSPRHQVEELHGRLDRIEQAIAGLERQRDASSEFGQRKPVKV